MTNRAPAALLRCRQAERLSDARGAGVGQNSICARMKVLLRPRHILAAFFAGSAVATGRIAADHTNELTFPNWRNVYLHCQAAQDAVRDKDDHTQPGQNVSDHVLDTSGNRSCKPSEKLCAVVAG